MATMTRPPKRQRTSTPVTVWGTPGTLVVFSDPPATFEIGRAGTSVELGGRLWEAEVVGDDESALRLSATTMSDDSKVALTEVLAARSHEALQREEEAEALGADLELLMERAREVCICCCIYMGDDFTWVPRLCVQCLLGLFGVGFV